MSLGVDFDRTRGNRFDGSAIAKAVTQALTGDPPPDPEADSSVQAFFDRMIQPPR